MGNFVKVASVNDVRPGQGKCVMLGGREIALFNCDGTFFAVDNVCPHQGGPLGDGDVQGTMITCPWHGWRFDVRTGVSPVNSEVKISRYDVKVEGNDVWISA